MIREELIEILELIESNGYEAYLVGGFPRDYYMNRECSDYDICTNARPWDLNRLFDITTENYGSVKIKYKNIYVEITTYRKELEYLKNRKPLIEFVDSLSIDLLRRDFTINAICMDKNKNYIDLLNGANDINNCKIRMIGNSDTRIKEDPLRILRAIRFAAILNFDIVDDLSKSIKENRHLIKKLSYFRKKEELDKIFTNAVNGIRLLNEYQLSEYLEIDMNNIIPANNYLAIWAQIKYSPNYQFSKKEIKKILLIKELLKVKLIEQYEIYKYGIELCILVGQIRDIKEIELIELEKSLSIKNRHDIKIQPFEIEAITNHSISYMYDLVEKEILKGKLNNNKEEIIDFIKSI